MNTLIQSALPPAEIKGQVLLSRDSQKTQELELSCDN